MRGRQNLQKWQPGVHFVRTAIVLALAVIGPVSVQLHAQEFDKIKPLFFTKPYGGADPLPQILTVTGGSSAIEFSTSARTSSGGDWLAVSRTQDCCTTPALVSVTVHAGSSLEPGSYSGEVVLTGTGASRVVEVYLVVTPAESTAFDKTPSQMSFSIEPGGTASPQVMQISGVGPEVLQWRLIASTFNDANFLSVSVTSGTGPTRIAIGVVPENLPDAGKRAGVYTGRLLFISARSSVTIPIKVLVGDRESRSGRPLPMSKSAGNHSAASQPATGSTNLFPANTSNCFCGAFNSTNSNYGGLTTAPDGTSSAQLVGEANPENGVAPHVQSIFADMGPGQHTISFHLKADIDSWAYITSQDNQTVNRAWFNLANGTVGTLPSGWTAQITAVPGAAGWYRCSVTFTSVNSATNNGLGLATGDSQSTYVGTYGHGVYEWGQEFDNGTLTAYQPNASPCLSFDKTADAATVSAGSSIGYTMTLFNHATPPVTTTLTDQLPAGTGVSWTISPGNSACSITGAVGSQALTCNFPALAAATSNSVHVVSGSSASGCGAYNNTATLTASGYPSYSATANASTTVSCSGPNPPVFQTLSTPGSSGTSGLFSLQYSDADGNADFYRVQVAINDYLRGFRSCLVYYTAGADVMYLLDDLGATWQGPIAFGATGVLTNSQCSLNMGLSTRVRSGNNLTLNLYFTFNPGFTGAKSVFTEMMDNHALSPGWQTVGAYTVAAGTDSPPSLDTLTPASGSGSNAIYRFKLSDPDGGGDLDRLQVIFQNGFNASNSCYVYYAALSGLVYLANDNPATFQGPVLLGQSVTLQNSQCQLRVGTSSVTYTGNSMEVDLDIAFKSPFAGAKTIYAETRDRSGVGANTWQTMGTWTAAGLVNLAPTVDSVNPSSGSGTTRTFTIQYSDGNGYADMDRVQVLFNSTLNFGTGCLLQYVRGANLIYLQNDAGTGWVGPALLGTAGTLQNSRCSLNVGSATATGSVNSLQLALPMTFQTSTFSGLKNTYGEATDSGGLSSNWHAVGTWSVQ